MGLQPPEPLTPQHGMSNVDCGDASLNQWLQQRADANQRSGATRTFVVCDADGAVKACIALASGALSVARALGGFGGPCRIPFPATPTR